MNLIRYEPWSALRCLSRDFDDLLEPSFSAADRPVHWVPAVDIREHDDSYLLRADLPGIDPQDIDISMEDGRLTLRGERVAETQKGNRYARTERVVGKFLRRFDLPDTTDADGIKATSHNGVLTVTIPKKPQLQPRRITVDVA